VPFEHQFAVNFGRLAKRHVSQALEDDVERPTVLTSPRPQTCANAATSVSNHDIAAVFDPVD